MVKCKFEHGGYCCNRGSMEYMDKCKKPCDTIEPITNADRIRAMNDEELAAFIEGESWMCGTYNSCYECPMHKMQGLCFSVLEWLKQPAKDGE